MFTKLYKKNYGDNIVFPDFEKQTNGKKEMNVNNITTKYTPASNQNSNRPPEYHSHSIFKPLLYTYLTALAVIPPNTGDYFEKREQLEETKEKIYRPLFKNEPPQYLSERFNPDSTNANIAYQLTMANKIDLAQLEKVDDDKFRYTLMLDSKKVKGRLKFINDDKIIFGTAVINDLSKEISKSREYKFKIVLPNKKSDTFMMKILDANGNGDEKQFYTLKREKDGTLVFKDSVNTQVLNKKNADIRQKINTIESELNEMGIELQKEKDSQRALQLILAFVFLIEFMAGMSRQAANQE